MKITIVGMGALGILYGERITSTLGKEAVTFLADTERVKKYQKEGVYCNGKKCDFQVTDKAEPTDLLIFAVKGTTLRQAMEMAKDAVPMSSAIYKNSSCSSILILTNVDPFAG